MKLETKIKRTEREIIKHINKLVYLFGFKFCCYCGKVFTRESHPKYTNKLKRLNFCCLLCKDKFHNIIFVDKNPHLKKKWYAITWKRHGEKYLTKTKIKYHTDEKFRARKLLADKKRYARYGKNKNN